MHLARFAATACLMLAVGCAAPPSAQRTELFFGLNRPNGGAMITDAEWRMFVDDVVTPRFPAGLTVLDAHGQWRSASGTVEGEASHVLILLHTPTSEDERKIEGIRRIYKERFGQESVLRVDTPARVSF